MYILFNKNNEYLGIRATQPSEEENLIVFEWYEDFVNVIEPTLKDGKIVSGEIVIDIEQLDKEYTQRISDLVEKHVQKKYN